MAAVRVKVNRRAIRALLTSDPVRDDIKRRSEAIAAACNAQSSWGGYVANQGGASRARATIFTVEREAIADNARNARMLRNLDAGRS